MTYVIPCNQPNFQQSLDRTRDRVLLTANPSKAGQLTYQYTDTGETVLVPNIWYNQTNEMRVGWALFQAQRAIEYAKDWAKNPPKNASPASIEKAIADYTAQYELHKKNAQLITDGLLFQ